MKQLVSILIPAYNAEKWISDCIELALAQTWRWKEIIVVDDGSRDSTLRIAKSFTSSNVHVITQDNSGASEARNHALSLAQGDYIQWLDADDLLARDKIARQLEGAELGHSSRVLLSGAWGRFYFHPEMSKFAPNSLWEDMEPVEWLFRKLNENLWMPPAPFLVSRRLTEMTSPWNETLSLDDDGEYFCRIISCSHRIRFISEACCFKRNTFGMSSDITLSNRKLDSLAFSILSYIQHLRALEDSLRTRDACLNLINRWTIYFYPERQDLMQKMQLAADDLGGKLELPKLRSKYKLFQRLFGWSTAKKAQQVFPAIRSVARKQLEHLLFYLPVRKETWCSK